MRRNASAVVISSASDKNNGFFYNCSNGFCRKQPQRFNQQQSVTVSTKLHQGFDPLSLRNKDIQEFLVPVCHESELPEPYDFRTSSIGNENIIICRAPDGKINALLNVPIDAYRAPPAGQLSRGQASGNPKQSLACFMPAI